MCPLEVGTETLRCSDHVPLNSGQRFPPFQYLLCACQEKEDFHHNEQTLQKAFYSFSQRVFFFCGASQRCSFLRWSLSRRLINLSFVLGDISGKFGMGVTSQDRFAGMGDLVCFSKDWREAEMLSSITSFT